MTTYGPDPDVPTAGVLPVDDCVIAPPVTATSTVFRTPNCPTIRWEASRCREPSARAFAVTGTSNMEPRMVGGVHRPGLRFQALSAAVASLKAALRAQAVNGHCAARGRADRPPEVRVAGVVAMPLHCSGLAAGQRSHICSEGDVTHGSAGGRRCFGHGSQSRPLGLPRHCYPSRRTLARTRSR